jgi:hypothetical protein
MDSPERVKYKSKNVSSLLRADAAVFKMILTTISRPFLIVPLSFTGLNPVLRYVALSGLFESYYIDINLCPDSALKARSANTLIEFKYLKISLCEFNASEPPVSWRSRGAEQCIIQTPVVNFP